MKHILWTLLVLLLFSCPAYSWNSFVERYNRSILNMTSGLPNNFVEDIYEDSNGFVWISTRGGGLVRYDGYSYLYFGIGNQGIALKSNSCRNVDEDGFQRLWIAFEECIDVIDLRTLQPVMPKCTTEALSNQLMLLMHERSIRVYRDSKGKMWLLTAKHFCRLTFNADGEVCRIDLLEYTTNTPDVAIKDLFSNGKVFVGCGGQLCQIHTRRGRLFLQPVKGMEFPGLFITDMIRDKNHIWVATNGGLYRMGGPLLSFHHNETVNSLSHDFVSSLALTPNGRLLIGTLGGVDLFAGRQGTMEHWNVTSKVNPLSSNFVNCILTRNGQIWVGTETGGIVKLIPRQLELTNYFHTDDPSSLSPNAVNAMFVEPNGTLWVGTVEGGLNRRESGSNVFEHYTTRNSGLSHNSVSTLVSDSEGRLWIGTWGGGISILDLKHPSSIRTFSVDREYASLLTFVGALAFDSINNGMWIGTNEGVYFYDFNKHRMEEPFPGCRTIRGCIGTLVTKQGQLWMGCGEGLIEIELHSRSPRKKYFQMKQLKYKLDNPKSGIIDKITSFCQTRDGSIWMGSNGYGLYRLSYKKQHPFFKAYTMEQGLANNAVKGIVEDRQGLLWITTDHGLSQFNPRTGVFTNYMEDDGLLSSQFYYNSAIRSKDGHLFLGTDKGLIELSGEDTPYIYSGRLHFSRLLVGNQEVRAHTRYLTEDISIAKQINLHESDRSFTVEFSSLSYGSETQGAYSYRMKGFENEWMHLYPGQHSVRYSTLPSGHYKFEVKYTSSMNGNNHDQLVSIDVRVIPYFWKSWWFISLMVLFLSGLIILFYKRRIHQLRMREVEQLYRPIEIALKESKAPGVLQKRIQNILHNQKCYNESWMKSVEVDREETGKKVKPFMEQVMEILEKNYGDSEFGVPELCEKINMTRSALSLKLNRETGVSTSQFIRNYRLDIAKTLIMEHTGNRNIAEIAFRVGFNDPKYFTRCFTKQYGVSPSAYKCED